MAFVWSYKGKIKQRQPYFQELARNFGLGYQEKDEEGFVTFLKDIKIFKIGRPQKQINNIVFSEEDDPMENFYFFDYHYVISTGNSTQIIDQTVFFGQSKKLLLPEFELVPKSFFHRVGEFFGRKKPDLGDPWLTEKFLLKTESPKVLEWINEKEFLDILERNPKLRIYGYNFQLVLFKHRKLAKRQTLQTVFHSYRTLYEFFKSRKDFLKGGLDQAK
ncbi:MAG: hypothetical protein HKN16_03515 [Saprospiraceae bacterium]|nr:hypothetical protein [Saprospiraceae bacterium]